MGLLWLGSSSVFDSIGFFSLCSSVCMMGWLGMWMLIVCFLGCASWCGIFCVVGRMNVYGFGVVVLIVWNVVLLRCIS